MNPWIAQVYVGYENNGGFPFSAVAKHRFTGKLELDGRYNSHITAIVNARSLADCHNRACTDGSGRGDTIGGRLIRAEEYDEEVGWKEI